MKIMVIDNYDSFVHNLARYFRMLGCQTDVVRNDELTVGDVVARAPTHVVLSPGPCTPDDAGICVPLVQAFAQHIPILGVCLGHQAIAQAFGGKIVRAKMPMHGKPSVVQHDGRGIFSNIPSHLTVGRYHSLIVEAGSLPDELMVTAHLDDGTIMAIAHRQYPVWGVQFHPESVLTQCGEQMIENFLKACHVELHPHTLSRKTI